VRVLAGLGFVLSVACARQTTHSEPPVVRGNESFELPSEPDAGVLASDAQVAADVSRVCSDELGSELARVSCDRTKILVASRVDFHPQRPGPDAASKKVLERVAALLRERPEILLVRVEVYARKPFGKDAEQNRALLLEAQSRADALLQWLYRRQGISAERLEAAGYPRKADGGSEPFPVVFRIVQRRAIENSATAE